VAQVHVNRVELGEIEKVGEQSRIIAVEGLIEFNFTLAISFFVLASRVSKTFPAAFARVSLSNNDTDPFFGKRIGQQRLPSMS